jgi:hypothetical protein
VRLRCVYATATHFYASAYAFPKNTTAAVAGLTLTDTAILSGAYFPNGTMTFTLTGPGGFNASDQLSGCCPTGPFTVSFTLPPGALSGTYTFNTTYADDPNNMSAAAAPEFVNVTVPTVPGPIAGAGLPG